MPSIYLSPSLQECNLYITGGNEAYYMNLIADVMEPYLLASGIAVVRSSPGDTTEQIIEQSNAVESGLHLALHSGAAPARLSGALRGPDVRYYAYSETGEKAAAIFTEKLKAIYPDSGLVTTAAETRLPEICLTKAPALLVEMGFHDNSDDADWITGHIGVIARSLALSATEYLGVPFTEPDVH